MTLPLKESRAVRELADVLYDFLPGSGNPKWKGHVSFKSIANKVGVGNYWQPGSKTPMIINLLEQTLEHRRDKFEPLVLEIVRSGLTYRQKQNSPITPEEIERINGLILEIGFKFPDLWDPDFIASLRVGGTIRASALVEQVKAADQIKVSETTAKDKKLEDLKNTFLSLHTDADRQSASLKLEGVLNELFQTYDLSPRAPFRVIGEQIDGSFELDHEVYLVEAKWHKDPRPAGDLYVFREKVEGKSKFTRGVFIAINGVTNDAVSALTHGKQANFFIIDGYDLMMLLQGAMDFIDFLRQRQRLLADDGRVCVPFQELSH